MSTGILDFPIPYVVRASLPSITWNPPSWPIVLEAACVGLWVWPASSQPYEAEPCCWSLAVQRWELGTGNWELCHALSLCVPNTSMYSGVRRLHLAETQSGGSRSRSID